MLYVVPDWPPERTASGIVTSVAALSPALRSFGHEVRHLALSFEADAADPWTTWLKAGAAGGAPLRYLRDRLSPHDYVFERVPRMIARQIIDVPALRACDSIEMEESFGWSELVARRTQKPVVTRLHGPFFLTGAAEGGNGDFLRKRVLREGRAIGAAAGVSAPSKFVLDAVRDHYGLQLRSAAVIPNPIDVARAAPRTHIGRDANEILFVGRFDRIKGADVLLRAFAIIAEERPEMRLTFAGPTDTKLIFEGREIDRQSLCERLLSPEARMRVDFVGRQTPDQLASLRARAGVVVIPSRIEMMPYVALEALADGCPTIASNVGGIPEIIRDGVDGLLVEPDEPHLLANAVKQVLDNPDFASRLSAAARSRVRDAFAAEPIARMAADFHAGILSQTARARS